MNETIPSPEQLDELLILKAALLDLPGIRHGFATRRGGGSVGPWRSLNVSMNENDEASCVVENRRRLARQAGFAWESVVLLSQVHGREVLRVDRLGTMPREHERRFDASISNQTGALLAVQTADCVPILVASTQPRAVCAIHAGWRGTLQNVTGAAIRSLVEAYGCKTTELVAAIGPCIHACCYQVDTEVFEQFRTRFGRHAVSGECALLRVDLVTANRMLLEATGIPPTQIEVIDLCTSCREDLFFSHRRDRGVTGRQLAFIELLS
jgi:YfiH family protein